MDIYTSKFTACMNVKLIYINIYDKLIEILQCPIVKHHCSSLSIRKNISAYIYPIKNNRNDSILLSTFKSFYMCLKFIHNYRCVIEYVKHIKKIVNVMRPIAPICPIINVRVRNQAINFTVQREEKVG